jgi:hypothetical protein
MPCLKCSAEAQVEEVRLIDRAHPHWMDTDFTAEVSREPGALLFRDAVTKTVTARVCGACGFLELYVKNPGSFVRAAETRSRNRAAAKAKKK